MSIAKDLLSSTLSFLEMTLTSNHRLSWTAETPQTTKLSLVRGCKGQPRQSLAFGSTGLAQLVGLSFHLYIAICHSLQQVSGLKQRLFAQDPGCNICDKLELGICTTAEASSGVLCPVLGSPLQER